MCSPLLAADVLKEALIVTLLFNMFIVTLLLLNLFILCYFCIYVLFCSYSIFIFLTVVCVLPKLFLCYWIFSLASTSATVLKSKRTALHCTILHCMQMTPTSTKYTPLLSTYFFYSDIGGSAPKARYSWAESKRGSDSATGKSTWGPWGS